MCLTSRRGRCYSRPCMVTKVDENLEVGVPLSLEQAVREIDLLLAYASQRGIYIEKATIDSLTLARRQFDAGATSVDAAVESGFWLAYQELANAIDPVSVVSIKANSKQFGRVARTFFLFPRPVSLARLAVRRYQRVSIAALIVLLIVQVYAGIGARLLNDFEAKELEQFKAQQELDQALLNVARPGTPAERQQRAALAADFKNRATVLEDQLESRRELINWWNFFYNFMELGIGPSDSTLAGSDSPADEAPTIDGIATPREDDPRLETTLTTPAASEQTASTTDAGSSDPSLRATDGTTVTSPQDELRMLAGQATETERIPETAPAVTPAEMARPAAARTAIGLADRREKIRLKTQITVGRIILEALNVYLLPLIYGLLGACAYVLRRLSLQIREYQYSPDSEVRLQLRLYLGALSGFAIAWFINDSTTPGLLQTITPLALAFIGGYSVEVVFAAMDNLVNTFSNVSSDKHSNHPR